MICYTHHLRSDAAWNFNHRTNYALMQSFTVDRLNQLTTLGRSGTMTVAGGASTAPTSVTVKDNNSPPPPPHY